MDPTDQEARDLGAWIDGDGELPRPEGLDPDIEAAAATLKPVLSRPFQPDFAKLQARLPPQRAAAADTPVESASPAPSSEPPAANNTRWFAAQWLAVAALALVILGGLALRGLAPEPAPPTVAQLDPAVPYGSNNENPHQTVSLDPRAPLGPDGGAGTPEDPQRPDAAAGAALPAGVVAVEIGPSGHGAVSIGQPLPRSASPGLTSDAGAPARFDTVAGRQTVRVEGGVVQTSVYRFRFEADGAAVEANPGPLPEARAQTTADALRDRLSIAPSTPTSDAEAAPCTAPGVRQEVTAGPGPDGAWIVEARAYADAGCP